MTEVLYRFGPYVFDGKHRVLLKNGAPIAIGQRGIALLEALIAADGRNVSKDVLLRAAWGTDAIEESNLSVQIAALRKALGRKNDGSEWIMTIQRLGYQFVNRELPPKSTSQIESTAPTKEEKPAVAVLPFTNLSTDEEQKYFADGLAEDLITELSKSDRLTVIARHSSFSYRESAASTGDIASALGVTFLVEGSVRRSQDRVRISVQLVDAKANSPIWADRFDGQLEDIFKLQDEVVAKIIVSIVNVMPTSASELRQPTTSLEAYDLFVRGRLFSLQSPEENRFARPLLERACALDPQFAEPHAWLAMNLNFGWMYCYEQDCGPRVQALAEKAIALDAKNADAHLVLGYLSIFNGGADLDTGREQFRIARTINPNHADGHMFSADLAVLEGKPEQAFHDAERAFQLNPHPPSYYHWLFSWILYAGKRYEKIVEIAEREKPQAIGFQRNLAAALAQLGRVGEAHKQSQLFMLKVPQFTIKSWIDTLPFQHDNDRQHFIEGYVKAGFAAS
jgi:TolB-like protein